MFRVQTLRPIYFVCGLDCDRASELHCGLPLGSTGVRLLYTETKPEILQVTGKLSKGSSMSDVHDSPSVYQEMDEDDAVPTFASSTSKIPRTATIANDDMHNENHYGGLGHPVTLEDVEERQQQFTGGERVDYVPDEPPGKWCHWPTLVAYVGPGFLVCIAYLDPGNLEADLQTGAYTGYQLLWVLLSAHIMGLVLQSLAARLGVVTGTHLADMCRRRYPRIITWLLWVMTESAIIGSDIQEVVGSAIGLQILLGIPLWAGCLLTALDTFTFLFIHIFGVRKLEGLFVFLVSVMTVSFFVEFFMSPPTAGEIVEGFTFAAESYATVTALGLIGAVIMPHNIYLHSALVLSRDIDRTNKRKLWEATKYYTIDSGIALFVAFLINLAVVCSFAKQFYDKNCATASTTSACFVGESIDLSQPTYGTCDDGEGVCQEIGLSAAAAALKGSLGKAAKYVWAVGLLAAGQSSTMTGTYAGQFVMEGFLQLKIPKWQRVLLTRIIALGPALAVTVAMGSDIRATDRLSAWLNVLQSLQLPFAVIPLLTFCASNEVMGEFAIKPAMTVFVWILALGIIFVNIYIVGDFVEEEANESERADVLYTFSGIIMTLYLLLIAAVVWQDMPCCWQEAISPKFAFIDRFRSSHFEGCSRIGNDLLTGIGSDGRVGGAHRPVGSRHCRVESDRQLLEPGLGEGSSSARWAQFAPAAGPLDEEEEAAGAWKRARGEERKSERRVEFSLPQEHEAR